jgi:hypothetical protein
MKTKSADPSPSTELSHPDPLTGEPGAHPVGTAVGAVAASAALGAVGALAGPLGAAVGVTVGAVLGGLTGKGFAEGLHPTITDAYWREQHPRQPYADANRPYEAYARAYHVGHAGYREGKSFEECEADLRLEYEGGPQKPVADHAEEERRAAEAQTWGEVDSMENNLRTHPPRDPAEIAERVERSMEDHMRTSTLEWVEARPAVRAAYERAQAETAKRFRQENKRLD